jgi:hypothetical protein
MICCTRQQQQNHTYSRILRTRDVRHGRVHTHREAARYQNADTWPTWRHENTVDVLASQLVCERTQQKLVQSWDFEIREKCESNSMHSVCPKEDVKSHCDLASQRDYQMLIRMRKENPSFHGACAAACVRACVCVARRIHSCIPLEVWLCAVCVRQNVMR